jgi:hypothetical protein
MDAGESLRLITAQTEMLLLRSSDEFWDIAGQLFELADCVLALGEASLRAKAEGLVLLGAANILQQEDLEAFDALPLELNGGPMLERVRPLLEAALSNEIDYLRDQSDPDVVAGWISEVESRAERYGVSVYLDSAFEWLDELQQRPVEEVRGPATASTPRLADDYADEDIRKLFSRLL